MKKLFFALFCSAHLFVYANQPFALSLYPKLTESQDNLVFSPYSLFANLSLLTCGAQGITQEELMEALHLPTTRQAIYRLFDPKLPLVTTTALFTHHDTALLPAFLHEAQAHFGASVLPIDFYHPTEALTEMNGWIQEKTGGKIAALIHENDLDAHTRLVMANAVYFEEKWAHPFPAHQTHSAFFYPEESSATIVEMVQQTHPFPYLETDDFQMVSLPFAQTDGHTAVDCLLLLPKEHTSLSALEHQLQPDALLAWKGALESAPLTLQIPKFTLSQRVSMNEALQALGIQTAYTSEADFAQITGARDLFLQTCLHEAYFAFDEEGVTAAAATTAHMGLTAVAPGEEDALSFVAERPFLFLIVSQDTNDILFMGRYAQPQSL